MSAVRPPAHSSRTMPTNFAAAAELIRVSREKTEPDESSLRVSSDRAAGNRIRAHVIWEPSNSDSFVTKPGAFTDTVVAAIKDVTGRTPDLNTGGGTSDARFIKNYCPVIEFGLVGQTMHQIDEHTKVADLEKLTQIYRGVLDRYFA